MTAEDHALVPDRACLHEAIQVGAATAFAGLFLGAAVLAYTHQLPAGSSVTRYLASTTAQGALLGGAFAGTSCAVSQARHGDDAVGAAAGGFATGALIGLRQRNMGMVFGLGTGFAATAYLFALNQNSLRGPIGKLSFDDRKKWNQDTFWKNPVESPASRALVVAEEFRQQQ
ncbi:hypothetical protein H9P43_008758 [Blastocladiella emersonii ATCC 22665]|nr:hypothetical protein H9P43_008758 [Blastocladiella emersonii ATCC 22665]